MRLFVALFPPESVRDELGDRLAASGARLIPADRWHITLAFLGAVAPERRPEVDRALDGVRHGPLRLRLSGGGSFGGDRGRSKAMWAGVEGDVPALHDKIRGALAGFELDARPFTPHLTVAYAHAPRVRDVLAGYAGGTWTAHEFVLVHSAGGYERLRSWPLR